MPNLTYMLTYVNMAAHDKNWGAFGSDPEWKKLSSTPGYTDAEIISNISNLFCGQPHIRKSKGNGWDLRDCFARPAAYAGAMKTAKKLLHTRYRVDDLERTVKFYREVLGLEETRRHKSPRGSELVFMKAPESEELIELCSFPASGPVQVQPDLTHLPSRWTACRTSANTSPRLVSNSPMARICARTAAESLLSMRLKDTRSNSFSGRIRMRNDQGTCLLNLKRGGAGSSFGRLRVS